MAALPADHTITQINFKTRILLALGLGASWWGWKWKVVDGPLTLVQASLDPGTQPAPVTFNMIKSGLAIATNDFNAGHLHLISEGLGWGFFQAYIQLSELDIIVTHEPAVNPMDIIYVQSPIRDPVVGSPIEDPNVLSPMADPVVGSPIEDPHVLSPIKEIEWFIT